MNNFNNNNNFGMGMCQPSLGGLNITNAGYSQGSLGLNLNNYTNDTVNNNYNMGGTNNMNYQNQNERMEENYAPLEMDIVEQEFDGVLKTKLTTTTDLAKTLNKIFKPVFSDYVGSLILPNQMGGFDTVVYFKDSGIKDERAKAIQHLVQQANNGQLTMSERIQNINTRYRNKTYDLTRDCKDVFKEFMITERNNNKKINWNRYVVEKTEPNYNGYSVYVQLNGIDIMKIIRKLYGGTSKDGKRIDYSMRLERGLGVVNNNGLYTNYLVSIMQLDTREVEKIAQSVGMVPLANNIPMVR